MPVPKSDLPFVPLVDLGAQMELLREDIDRSIAGVLNRGDFILGQDVTEFETEFEQFCGGGHAIGCASGTDALSLSLRAFGIGTNDEVIMPAMTFVATALAISLTGAKPVLVDVLPDNALIDPAKVAAAITPQTKAIMPVHLFGQCADMTAINAIAVANGLTVIEDAAQAHGASHGKARAGTMGNVAGFSFYPGKNLGAYGDAGIITTMDADLAQRLKLLRNWGSLKKYHHEEVGLNSRLDTLQAAVLRVKLGHLEDWNRRRRQHAKAYNQALEGIPDLTLTIYDPGSVYHLYVVRTEQREELLNALNNEGIGAGIHYPFAVHELQAYRHLGYEQGDFPLSEKWARQCVSLPIYPELPESAILRSAEVIRRILG